jgi:CHASE3 domain sensor protein
MEEKNQSPVRESAERETHAMLNRMFNVRLLLLSSLVFVIIGFNTWLIYYNFESVQQQFAWVDHTSQVKDEIDNILLAAANAGAAFRGYLVVGQDSFLAPYKQGRQDALTSTDRVETLTHDNPVQYSSAKLLSQLVKESFETIGKSVQERSGTPLSRERMEELISVSKLNLDEIRNRAAQMNSV